jgi:hypothetical protein
MAAVVGVLIVGGTALTVGYLSRKRMAYYFGFLQVYASDSSLFV